MIAAALLAVASAAAEPSPLTQKRSEAQRVLAEIAAIDMRVGQLAEAYNLASLRLSRIEEEQRLNRRRLALARLNLGHAQRRLQERLVTLYTSGEPANQSLAVILGATSLEDLLERLEAAERVSDQDAHVLGQVRTFRSDVERRRGELARARESQARVVAARAAAKRQVEGKLAERRRLLSGIRGEIARLEAAERARQAELERQARARLRAQQAAARQQTAQAGPGEDAAVSAAPESEPAAAPPPPAQASAPAPAARYGGVVGIAMQYLGVPYKWGGASPSTGFDCSGFVMYVFGKLGVSLPHSTYALYAMGTPVSRDALQPGDLVFFHGLGHMGIYIGGGSFIHSPRTGDVVKISPLSGWYSSRWVGARRL